MTKVDCKECNKKFTHAHKKSSDHNSRKEIVGDAGEYNRKLSLKLPEREVKK